MYGNYIKKCVEFICHYCIMDVKVINLFTREG